MQNDWAKFKDFLLIFTPDFLLAAELTSGDFVSYLDLNLQLIVNINSISLAHDSSSREISIH